MRPHLLLLTATLACSGKGDDSGAPADAPSEARVATYNAGLATGFVTFAPEREAEVVSALSGLDADIVCLQEVWTAESIDAITDGVSGTFPHSYVEITAEAGADEPACTEDETTPLADCAREFCSDAENLTNCVLASCSEEFNALSDPCTECAAANIGLDDVDAIVETCLTGSSSFAWGGHNGLVLLSREALSNTQSIDMDAWLVWRSAISAEVGGLDVTCTHLSAALNSPAYGGADYESYEAEQAGQIDALLSWVDDRVGDGPAVILGDMNTGPAAAGGIEAELPDNWAKFGAAGWVDPNVESGSPFCTWCADNTIAGEGSDHESVDTILDHVLVRGATGSNPERVLDGTVTVSVDGVSVETSLSDHYGAAATATW